MSTTTRKTHRDLLLEAAKKLLRERAYGNITARDLVAASGTNLGSIGYHFGSKEALLNEAIGEALEEWTEALAAATRSDAGATPFQQLAGTWSVLVDDFDRVRPYFLAFIEALPRSARSAELRSQLAAHYARQRDRVAGMLAEPFTQAAPDDLRPLATYLIAVADGLMLQAYVDPEHMPSTAELGAALAKVVPR